MTIRIDVFHHLAADVPKDSSLAQILAGILKLEKQMSKQDDSINALKSAFDGFKADVGATMTSISGSLDNIVADEAAQTAKLDALDGLSPANQAVVDDVIAGMQATSASLTAVSEKAKGVADSIPDVA